MSQLLQIHAESPQPRLVRVAVQIIREGGVVVYPTDSCYALGCLLGNKEGMERIRRIRGTAKSHLFTLVCRDVSQIAAYARVGNAAYRFIRARTPGPYTFVLRATREVPKRVQSRRQTIGIRVPDHAVPLSLLEELGEPVMSTTLHLPGDDVPLSDALDIRARLEQEVDAVIDGGNCGLEPTTVIDLVDDTPQILRQGRGDVAGIV